MTGAIGTFALLAGLAASVCAALIWLVAAVSPTRLRSARIATACAALAAFTACAMLELALVTNDFGVRYVAENGGRSVPLYYKISSLWSALDGSLLLWLLILACAATLLAAGNASGWSRERAWAMATVGFVEVFFFALAFFAANPFDSVDPAPPDGPGPNPLLREHPAMGVHPPLLYAGYVGMVIPFACAVAAMITGSRDDGWVRPARRWALAAWILLTVGIVLGAWWSYAVLGWGGYWAWDPVENASFLPWLTATAGLHVTMGRRRRSTFTGWAVALFCATFLLVLVGTFLTRSGAVASVHSFTESPLGPMLLGFVVLVTALVVALLLRGRPQPTDGDEPLPWWSRDTGFLYQATLLVAIAAIVLTGTLYPLLSSVFSGGQSAVSAAYYDRATAPLFLAVLILMGVVQLIPAGGTTGRDLGKRLMIPACTGLGTVIVVGALTRPGAMALLTFGAAAFVITGVAAVWFSRDFTRSRPGLLAHTGVAVVAIGIAASSAYTVTRLEQIGVGDSVTAGGVRATLTGIERQADPDRMTVGAHLVLTNDGRRLASDTPVLHYYPGRDVTVAVPAIRSYPFADVYATVTAADDGGQRATIRLSVNPFISLLWLGGAVIALGGLLALRRRGPHAHDVDGTDESEDTAESRPADTELSRSGT